MFNLFKKKLNGKDESNSKKEESASHAGLKAIIGLGNPESRYQGTRHNIGFAVVQGLGTESGAEFKDTKNLFAYVAKVSLAGSGLILAMPTTYMNQSGKSFVAVLNWYKLKSKDILVVHDDVSLPLGRIRLQKDGGAGGQHGVESIIESLGGSKSFDRLKVGVGPDPGGERRADYVLSKFPASEAELLSSSLQLANQAAKLWFEKGINFAANACNGIDLITPPETPPN
jgi:PTH1 family peptidyl-tRNA hydrolase